MPRVVPDQPNPRYWQPAYPFGETKTYPLDERSEDVGKWHLAPATSHCWGFRLIDARDEGGEGRFARKFGPGRGYNQGRSEIYVRFKDEATGGVAAEYVYRFDDHRLAADLFEELKQAAHPYGQVVHPKFIKGGVPYQRVS